MKKKLSMSAFSKWTKTFGVVFFWHFLEFFHVFWSTLHFFKYFSFWLSPRLAIIIIWKLNVIGTCWGLIWHQRMNCFREMAEQIWKFAKKWKFSIHFGIRTRRENMWYHEVWWPFKSFYRWFRVLVG